MHLSLIKVVPPLQVYPSSILQVEEQPSPDTVFPSSHSSVRALRLSPQIGEHEAEPGEANVAASQGVQAEAPANE